MIKAEDWKGSARRRLEALRAKPGAAAWGYRNGSSPCVEPTALAAWGLYGTRDASGPDGLAAIRESGSWLASVQRVDGSLGVSTERSEPGWGTPYGVLTWNLAASHEIERKRAVAWLLRQEGETMPRDEESGPYPGHDPSIVGWPWVSGTHSWVEPTALAVLALRREGLGKHPRVREGIRVLRDRAIVTGGWNCGNKAVFNHVLRPQPAPTGLALVALAHTGPRDEIVDRAAAYLLGALPGVRAAESLGWGVLGLRAWGEAVPDADRWLAESYARVAERPDAAPRIALLLLASGEHALEVFDAR